MCWRLLLKVAAASQRFFTEQCHSEGVIYRGSFRSSAVWRCKHNPYHWASKLWKINYFISPLTSTERSPIQSQRHYSGLVLRMQKLSCWMTLGGARRFVILLYCCILKSITINRMDGRTDEWIDGWMNVKSTVLLLSIIMKIFNIRKVYIAISLHDIKTWTDFNHPFVLF